MSAKGLRTVFAFLILCSTPTSAHWGQDTAGQQLTDAPPLRLAPAISDPLDRLSPWEDLDRARMLMLEGDMANARGILDSTYRSVSGPQFAQLRSELYAYVLLALNEDMRAIDTLEALNEARRRYHEQERALLRIPLLRDIEEQGERIVALERSVEEERGARETVLQWGTLIGLAIVFFSGMIAYLLGRRSARVQAVNVPSEKAIQELPVREEVTNRTVTAAHVHSGPAHSPLHQSAEARAIHDHTAIMYGLLSQGRTVEAGAQLQAFSRFYKLLGEGAERCGIERAMIILRQFVKLESMRAGKRVDHSIDADRSAMDAPIWIDIHPLIALFRQVMQAVLAHGTGSLRATMAIGSDDALICTISFTGMNVPIDLQELEGSETSNDDGSRTLVLTIPTRKNI